MTHDIDRPPNVPPVPPLFAERMRSMLGSEAEQFLLALEQQAVVGLRLNTLKTTGAQFQPLAPWALEPVPWCPDGFTVGQHERPGKHPYHFAGLYYMQDPSAMAVAEALAPTPGQLVLDLAAAPGGKATHLSALMGDTGLLVANEIDGRRIKALGENLERWGVRRSIITNEEPARLAQRWGAIFDRVLLDAPCSGEGMFRKSAAALEAWSPEIVRGCALRQHQAIEAAAALVRPGGQLVYSTCTFAPEENEAVIARFLKSRAEWELLPLALPGAAPGRPDWLQADLRLPELSLTARFWPHLVPGEGHFVALLRRKEGAEAQPSAARLEEAPPAAQELWQRFVATTLRAEPSEGHLLVTRGEQLYAVPEQLPALDGIRVMRPGLWLGTLHRDRFEPSHSLALMHGTHAVQQLELTPEDAPLGRYLEGHPLDIPGPAGWLLVTVSGWPIGWGRRAQGIIKNAYPKGLRRSLGT